MKLREGFVSNSSSSSFLITSTSKLSSETIIRALAVKESSPLFFFARALASFLTENAEVINTEDVLEEFGADTIEGLPSQIREAIESRMSMYYLSASYSEPGSMVEAAMSHPGWLPIDTMDLIISRLS